MDITVQLILALLVFFSAVWGIYVGDKYPWRWGVFGILVGLYMLIQQLPSGK